MLCLPTLSSLSATADGLKNPQWVTSSEGQLLLRWFKNAPYPHPSRADGFKTGDKVFSAAEHYSDSTVGIFIPKGFKPRPATDFVVHFHGHNNHVSRVFQQFDLQKQFVKSGLNAVLVVPQGPKDATDSGCGRLDLDSGAFKALMEEITRFLYADGKLRSEKIGRIALTAHSGGYRVTSQILDHGGMEPNITDVLLFDASYGNLNGFADWCSRVKGRRLVSIFTDHLAGENVWLMSLLQKRKYSFNVMMEDDLKTMPLTGRAGFFIHTVELEHNDVVGKRDYFAKFLYSSALAHIAAN